MNVPTTLWESTLQEPLGIFSAIEAVEILDHMTMPFNPNMAVMMNMQNLLEPFYVCIAINLKDDYIAGVANHKYKYRVSILLSKCILSLTPDAVKDLF